MQRIDATGKCRVSVHPSERTFLAVSAVAFAASTAVTVVRCASMTALGAGPMSGGGTVSMAWQRMPGQSWFGAAVAFLGMWVVMMTAMMLPSLVPVLRRYRRAIDAKGARRLGWFTIVVGAGYFAVWAAFGMAAFPLGVGLTTLATRLPAVARAVPVAAGAVVLLGGAVQFSAWKTRRLACWRASPAHDRTQPASTRSAWRLGLGLGLHCSASSASLTVILCVIGVMDLRAMAAVTTAITLERLAPRGDRVAAVVGAIVMVVGLILMSRALSIGA